MAKLLALVRANFLSAISYRLRMAFSVAGLLATIVPLYFIGNALDPVMAESIRSEGTRFFPFLVAGTMTYVLVVAAVNGLPANLASGIKMGMVEAMLGTPTRISTLLAGMVSYDVLWAAARCLLLLAAAIALGVYVSWDRLLLAAGILALIVLAHLPFGIMAGAMVLAFRTPGPVSSIVLLSSGLLGGVYYPVTVVPTWFQHISHALPLTYGLRAFRRTLLDGLPPQAVAADVMILMGFILVLAATSALAFAAALRYARRTGTLAQY